MRKGEGRWNRPANTFTRWSRPPESYTCFIRSNLADAKQNKRSSVSHRKIQNVSNHRLEIMIIFLSSRRCRRQEKNKISKISPRHAIFSQLLACVVIRHAGALTLRCGTGTAARRAFEPPTEDGSRTNRFDRQFQFRESHTEAEMNKNSD